MTIAIDTRNLSRTFGAAHALRDLSYQLPVGSLIALLGPNGAGKTTLLRLIAGLLAPTTGSLSVLGHDPRDPHHPPHYGWLDDQGPPRWLSLHSLGKLHSEASPTFNPGRYVELLLKKKLDPSRPFSSLSKGQQRWTQAALLFASAAPLLLLDEPADGLDTESRHDLYDLLRQHLTTHDATAIVATHALLDIEQVADHILLLHKGRSLLQGDLDSLRASIRTATLPSGVEPPPNLLAHAPTPEGDTVWYLHDPTSPLPNASHVNLEDLYLALVRHGLPTQTSSALHPLSEER